MSPSQGGQNCICFCRFQEEQMSPAFSGFSKLPLSLAAHPQTSASHPDTFPDSNPPTFHKDPCDSIGFHGQSRITSISVSLFYFVFIYLVVSSLNAGMWDLQLLYVGSACPHQGSTQGPCIRILESLPLGHQGSPSISLMNHICRVPLLPSQVLGTRMKTSLGIYMGAVPVLSQAHGPLQILTAPILEESCPAS